MVLLAAVTHCINDISDVTALQISGLKNLSMKNFELKDMQQLSANRKWQRFISKMTFFETETLIIV